MLLTLLDTEANSLSPTAWEVLAAAQGLDGPIEAVVWGELTNAPQGLASHGVERIHTIDVGDYSPEKWGDALKQLVAQREASSVLAASTERDNEVVAQLAAQTGQPLATNCVALSGGDAWELTRVRAGGVLLEDALLEAELKLATLATGTVEPLVLTRQSTAEPEVVPFDVQGAQLPGYQLIDRTQRGDGVSLATARVVVSGGRGVGSPEGFAPLEELAALLGGAVGCSRVATNNGWRSHSDQVGQTGTKVNPDLYIACGISGATQHWVGCMGSKAILAINTDPEAPMVTRASYAVIGDVHEVLQAVISEVRNRQKAE